MPTHSFIPYLIILPLGILLIEFLWISIVGIFHVLLDLIDWGIYPLTPRLKNKNVGGFLYVPQINEGDDRLPRCYFINTYYSSKIIIILEIASIVAALLLILWRNPLYLILTIPYVLFLIMHLNTYFKLCRKKN
ncbi:MAG: hypothetical protein EAX96_15020 [Candidatus Lokiarchaeota archaeon]|nr:hypothetical protein [Candidatus Lokiarchaeota archaeon]